MVSLAVIIVSEIGDKTFFIAAILAMTNNKLVVFVGALSALYLMTILSALLGFAVTTFIPHEVLLLSFYHYYSVNPVVIRVLKISINQKIVNKNMNKEVYFVFCLLTCCSQTAGISKFSSFVKTL